MEDLTNKIEAALNWWNNTLNKDGRSQFPIPKSLNDILAYYTNPAEYLYLEQH